MCNKMFVGLVQGSLGILVNVSYSGCYEDITVNWFCVDDSREHRTSVSVVCLFCGLCLRGYFFSRAFLNGIRSREQKWLHCRL